ncbi:binding-protein-dependent transport systems inner membrane component [Thermobaculum terrenum ATCC BAA-798]|uniref:Binding-protein-dependent transport systems inner membrane component n=1 Tax=Thermobaculum terrenum (strain ATCC BAA-798 / CCMEE 7001 / YNP1) TaxID=525904 RepID=D1CI40_THET1|nr:carbohydrate ABC transporter permease [Thermobaculum terrenum]ACZ43411.1 binding-protein-dependent transport systems inner membrane component [Thermobaculum terrenum ATCC BAA-798]
MARVSQLQAVLTARERLATRRWRRRLETAASLLIILVGAVIIMIPLAWMVSTSLKRPLDVYLFPPKWVPVPPQWGNYAEVFSAVPFGRYMLNSAFVSGMVVLGSVLSSSLAAYSFARLRSPGRDLIFMVLLSTLMLPGAVTIVPTFIVFQKLGWINTFKPLIVPAFFGNAFFIFLLRQFFLTIPLELEDAARIDGASALQIFWRVILPLSRPAIITVAIFAFIGSWNDFFTPLIYINSEDMYTVALGIANFQGSARVGPQMHLLMAASFIATLPVLLVFFLAQRLFIQGIVFTGIKG